ncbi:NETO2 protein, partial [Acromyrmex heyeri]
MLLRWALAVTTGKSRGHGRIARFKFIDVRANGSTMVARLPQQVLLLLVLVTGASTGETEDPRWSTYSARKTSRSSLPRSWPSSSLEHAARETRPSNGKLPETSSWSVERSSPGTRSDLSFLGTVVERSEEDEDGRRMESLEGNDTKDARITSHNPSISSRSSETSQTDPSNRISIESSSSESTTIGYHLVRTSSTSRSSYDIMPTPETQLSFETLVRGNLENTTSMTTYTKNFAIPRRHMRHVPDLCEKFQIGDPIKREFYSPNYPELYPNSTNCVRVLEADKGMLLKLDFRDEFKLEDSPDCRFDFLEVRDGQYGYSNLLGNFCGTNFPPEITSKTRYLWLRFHSDENIEGKGFKAVWNTIPRPTYPGIPPEQEPCIFNITGMEMIIHSDLVKDRKAQAEKEGLPLDCMWIIQVKEGWKIQLVLDVFVLKHPNECEANFVDIFAEKTDISSREKKFCGSIADTIVVAKNIAHLRFYAEPKALNSTFEAVVTAIRDKEKSCRDDEYDCEDMTCIAAELECNGKVNCRFKWDEEEEKCKKKTARLIDSHHIVIILVVFSLIMFGMSFAFVFNCVRKLIRDHRIIQEHIRQSRENRLDELGRKSTPCPISVSTTDLHDHGSESPSLEVLPSKELMPLTTIPQEYTKDLVLEMTYNASDIIDIHQSNNVSNATQERLQESSEEPEMRDNCCQTRESLFESRMPDTMVPYGFTTFGVRAPSSQNGTNHHHHFHLHRQQSQQSPQQSHQSVQSSQTSSQSPQQSSQQQSISQCSGCSPASRGRDGSMGICPKHNPIPAPPGWSTHESSYPLPVPQTAQYPEQLDYPSYQKFQSPKPSREPSSVYRQSPKFIRQATLGSGERYGSIYGSGHGSSNTTSSTSQHSSGNTPTKRQPQPTLDPRYRAEAVIEVDQRRPFSIESTKSAPDVIATH